VRQLAEARDAAATAMGARDSVVTAAAELRDGLADQQRQPGRASGEDTEMRRQIDKPDVT
jgi:hypothetical protein